MERKPPLTHLGNGLGPTADFALAGAAPRGTLGGEGGQQHLEDISARAAAEGAPGRERCTCTHLGPGGSLFPRAPDLVFCTLLRGPISPGPQPYPQTLWACTAPTRGAPVTGGLASPEGTLDLPENTTIFQCPWSVAKLPRATRLQSCQ